MNKHLSILATLVALTCSANTAQADDCRGSKVVGNVALNITPNSTTYTLTQRIDALNASRQKLRLSTIDTVFGRRTSCLSIISDRNKTYGRHNNSSASKVYGVCASIANRAGFKLYAEVFANPRNANPVDYSYSLYLSHNKHIYPITSIGVHEGNPNNLPHLRGYELDKLNSTCDNVTSFAVNYEKAITYNVNLTPQQREARTRNRIKAAPNYTPRGNHPRQRKPAYIAPVPASTILLR